MFFKAQTVDSLATVLASFDERMYNPHVIRNHALEFDKPRFCRRILQFIEAKLSAPALLILTSLPLKMVKSFKLLFRLKVMSCVMPVPNVAGPATFKIPLCVIAPLVVTPSVLDPGRRRTARHRGDRHRHRRHPSGARAGLL